MNGKIIKIDSEKCIGCGICAKTCKQSAIEMKDGKAFVASENYCDGIGNCLPVCPVNAISFSNKDVVGEHKKETPCVKASVLENKSSQLKQWPVQIKLVQPNASFFENANLLIAADCAAYAYANFHNEFMKNKVTIIGCPKLDDVDYTNKLTEIIKNNNIKSLTIVRMEVPCCGGIEKASINALKESLKFIPWQIVTLSVDGEILDN